MREHTSAAPENIPHSNQIHGMDLSRIDSSYDVAERYSMQLDQIPGFRDRHAISGVASWLMRNPTRQMGFASLGAALALGAAVYTVKRLMANPASIPSDQGVNS